MACLQTVSMAAAKVQLKSICTPSSRLGLILDQQSEFPRVAPHDAATAGSYNAGHVDPVWSERWIRPRRLSVCHDGHLLEGGNMLKARVTRATTDRTRVQAIRIGLGFRIGFGEGTGEVDG